MRTCLYDAESGYYTRGLNFTNPAHPKGRDFVTAPDLTPLFGQTLAAWVAREWTRLGKPAPFVLVEAGPGRGTLLRDLLARLQAAAPECFAAATPLLVETSPALAALQRQTLAAFPQCAWASGVPATAAPILLIANELLDAFPVRQFCGDAERTVVAENGALAFSHPDDAVTREDSPGQAAWLGQLKALPHLSALLIDYGAETLAADTLQALHRHAKVSPLHAPGDTDLTAHVNFGTVMDMLGRDRCALADLALFLLAHGLPDLALPRINEAETAGAMRRLLHPQAMGSLFKVLEYKTK